VTEALPLSKLPFNFAHVDLDSVAMAPCKLVVPSTLFFNQLTETPLLTGSWRYTARMYHPGARFTEHLSLYVLTLSASNPRSTLATLLNVLSLNSLLSESLCFHPNSRRQFHICLGSQQLSSSTAFALPDSDFRYTRMVCPIRGHLELQLPLARIYSFRRFKWTSCTGHKDLTKVPSIQKSEQKSLQCRVYHNKFSRKSQIFNTNYATKSSVHRDKNYPFHEYLSCPHALVAVQKSNVCATTGLQSVSPKYSDPISAVTQRPLGADLIAQPEANFPPPGVDDAPERHCLHSMSQICVLQK
jgi:hypothetical protein